VVRFGFRAGAELVAGATLDEQILLARICLMSGFASMANPRFLDEIGTRLSEILAKSPAQDAEKNVRALLAAFFERFDLVTREDFEVQKRVLERAQARISELEHRLGQIEAGRPDGQARN
jgi:BMFP domain-containing protein YqiC